MDGGIHDLRARELTMARELRTWIAATLLGCLVLGFVYLPPNAEPLFGPRFREYPPLTPYRQRVQDLAEEWRGAELERRLFDYRERLRPELERRRALDLPGPALMVELFGGESATLHTTIATALNRAWAGLGLGATKISVGVVIVAGATPANPDQPPLPANITAYLLPDSSDRSTCLVFLQGAYWMSLPWTLQRDRERRIDAFVQNALGPCAFYAAFGTPGRAIGRWLGSRRFDLALYPRWRGTPITGDVSAQLLQPDQPWFWGQVYRYPPGGVACLAGRRDACRAAVLDGAGAADPPPRVVTTQRWWSRLTIAGGDYYLADVVQSIGPERFRQFWSSDQAVDTALATALRMPVGEWTRTWQARIVPPIRLGPSVAPGSVLLSLLLAAVALAFVLRTVARREVR
jgi:hypothetical protein